MEEKKYYFFYLCLFMFMFFFFFQEQQWELKEDFFQNKSVDWIAMKVTISTLMRGKSISKFNLIFYESVAVLNQNLLASVICYSMIFCKRHFWHHISTFYHIHYIIFRDTIDEKTGVLAFYFWIYSIGPNLITKIKHRSSIFYSIFV